MDAPIPSASGHHWPGPRSYIAGGLDLLGVCDIAFAADDALFGQPEARAMGEIHVFGLWPIHLGMRKTKDWLFTGTT